MEGSIFFFKRALFKVFLTIWFEALSWLDVYMVEPHLIEYIKGVGKSSSPLLEIFM